MEIIQFGEDLPDLHSYESRDWLLDETRSVEFFPNIVFEVTLISTESPNLSKYLNEIDIQSPIALDLEWDEELCLFQFCINHKVLIVRHPKGPGNPLLYSFLKNHNFFAKGIHNDKIKLAEKFGENFSDKIEDIAKTRLLPYGYSINFIEMTLQFAGKPTADFKDIRITKSNWDLPNLSMRQILYAAFDVVSIFQAYEKFPPPKKIIKQPKVQTRVRSENNKPPPGVKVNKKERQTSRKEWKTDDQRIILKQIIAKQIFCYMIENYQGDTNYLSLNNILTLDANDIDNISSFNFNEKKYVFISLYNNYKIEETASFFSNQKKIQNNTQNIIKLDSLEPEYSTDNDVLFMYNLPLCLQDEAVLNQFFYCFGVDTRFIYDKEIKSIRIQPHRAQSSMRMKIFIPIIEVDGQKLTLTTFPYHLPMVRAIVPPSFSENEINSLFSQYGTIEKIVILKRKSLNDCQTTIITYSNENEANLSIQKLNYTEIEENEIYVQRFTDENHMRFLRFFELIITDREDLINILPSKNNTNETTNENKNETIDIRNEALLRKHYEKYGDILQVWYDKRFDVTRIIFINKKSAFDAAKNEKNTFLPPLGTMAFIRNLPLSTTDSDIFELTSPYGKMLNFVYRDIEEYMRTIIVEVMFSSHEEAVALKTGIHHKKIKTSVIEVNASSLAEIETPIWKMQQRKQWIVCETDMKIEEIIDQCEAISPIIKVKIDDQQEDSDLSNIFILFSNTIDATIAIRRIKNYLKDKNFHNNNNIRIATVSEFVNEIYPEQFILRTIENKIIPVSNQQPMALVICPKPKELNEEFIHKYLSKSKEYQIFTDDERFIIYTRSKKASDFIYNKLMYIKFNENYLTIERCKWYEVKNRPRFHPFGSFQSRKMPIIVDPIPNGANAAELRTFCSDCGKFDIKIEGSSQEIGKRRAIIQPRNTRAKVNCFNVLNSEFFKGEMMKAVRISRSSIPPPLDENIDDDVEYD
ncbi:hypothetical protein TRFO_40097 [Tritrichomonas foetus]|uniref:RRM domain-containing protein n=1 Tax=Tritrichomonas foetus TaxID=1144522 RepID=A0A1J4J8R6_9EUKA|nr:hypothetical protein TRFO_40097 [Tritrichomonas foetus]|eukprot:OHS93620.1 hypothetical protein TRFO_40097 [Tritrichomonas foetus]